MNSSSLSSLTPWRRVILVKPGFSPSQPIACILCEQTARYSVCNSPPVSCPDPDQSILYQSTSVLILSSYLSLCIPSRFFSGHFATKPLYEFFFSPVSVTCPTPRLIIGIFGCEYRPCSWRPPSCHFFLHTSRYLPYHPILENLQPVVMYHTNTMHIYNTCIIINTLPHVSALIAPSSGRTLSFAESCRYVVLLLHTLFRHTAALVLNSA